MIIEVLKKFREDLEKSMEKGLNSLNFDLLVQNVNLGHLFVMANDDAVIVFERKLFGDKKVVNTVLCGGELSAVEGLQRQLENDAKEFGADGVMIIGRKGWEKIFEGYNPVATVFYKEFEK